MKNKEYYVEEIMKLVVEREDVAVKNGKPISCEEISCGECDLNHGDCSNILKEWLEAEHKEKVVDWSKVPVDTKIRVRDSEYEEWKPRYFAQYDNGKVFSFGNGGTSYSTYCTRGWNYAELAEPNEEYMKNV